MLQLVGSGLVEQNLVFWGKNMVGSYQCGGGGGGVMNQKTLAKLEILESEKFAFVKNICS